MLRMTETVWINADLAIQNANCHAEHDLLVRPSLDVMQVCLTGWVAGDERSEAMAWLPARRGVA